jgi:hypothetical protein
MAILAVYVSVKTGIMAMIAQERAVHAALIATRNAAEMVNASLQVKPSCVNVLLVSMVQLAM